MVIHNRTVHPELNCMPGDPTFNFRMERMGLFKTPLECQVNEAIRNKNSKAVQSGGQTTFPEQPTLLLDWKIEITS